MPDSETQPAAAKKPTDGPSSPRRTRTDWQGLIDQQIEEAIRGGAFDNLPGKGKPLNLERNPFAPPDMEMANKLLLDNEFTPLWIADRNETRSQIDGFRTRLRQRWTEILEAYTNATPRERSALANQWRRELESWEQELAGLNRKIVTVNLTIPILHLEIFQLRLDEELRRIGASRNLPTP